MVWWWGPSVPIALFETVKAVEMLKTYYPMVFILNMKEPNWCIDTTRDVFQKMACSKITCEIHMITCEIYVIICKIYVSMCEIHVSMCEIHVIICEIHVSVCVIHVINKAWFPYGRKHVVTVVEIDSFSISTTFTTLLRHIYDHMENRLKWSCHHVWNSCGQV